MRIVLQRVASARVEVDGETIGAIERGVLLLLGVTHGDGEAEAIYLARKVAGLRLFEDEAGKMNLALAEVDAAGKGGAALVVSQFTLYGSTRKGRRPSFTNAARPEHAEPLYERFCELLADQGVPVARGRFGAQMAVSLVNDGPVTLWLDTDELVRGA